MNKTNIGRIFLSIFLLLMTGGFASATDWSIGNPTGLGYTNIVSDQFVITNNNASTGVAGTYHLVGDGTYTSSDIFTSCNNCFYTMINPIDNTRWGTDETGNVFYTTSLSPVSYGAGFFTTGVGGSCSGLGGNCNNLHRVATLTAESTHSRKLTFDSDGNVYTWDRTSTCAAPIIKKYVKSLGYSEQTFYTLQNAIDYTTNTQNNVLGIVIDSSNNLHLLTGNHYNVGCGGNSAILRKSVVSSSGTSIKGEVVDSPGNFGVAGVGDAYEGGGLFIDSTNGNSNFTYSFVRNTNVAYIKHNSTAGTTDICGGACTGITSVQDIGYNNFQIFLASPAQNLIRSYVTNFEGYGFTQTQSNPDGITGTFRWVNGYNVQVTTITPGSALAYMWTVSENNANYTYWTGWGTDTQTSPDQLRDLTDITTGASNKLVFNTNSNDLAGSSIYGYLLSRRNNNSSWSLLTNPQILTISPSSVGYDSITLDKSFYNLTGDTISATITYSEGWPYVYKWQVCARSDCADGQFFNQISLIGFQSSSTMATTGMQEGKYYAVLMRHLPVLTGLTNEIVASQVFEVRPPVIGVSWDKTSYNLFPKSLTTNTCQDATPSFNPWTNISGYAGLGRGWFSCSTTPAASNANNSIMRGSLFARYNGTFYLNNSLGSIWNGTLNNSSGALIYVLTNSSATETWTLVGVNDTDQQTLYANTEVNAESVLGYSLSVSPSTAYNGDTLSLTFTKPIFTSEYVILKDASGTVLANFLPPKTSGTYYIDPTKQYTYGTWTAYWSLGSIGSNNPQGETIFTFNVKNAGRPAVNGSLTPEGQIPTGSTAVSNLGSNLLSFMAMPAFWGLIIWILSVIGISMTKTPGKNDPTIIVAFLAANIEAAIGLWSPYTLYILALTWIIAAVMFLGSGIGKQTTTGDR